MESSLLVSSGCHRKAARRNEGSSHPLPAEPGAYVASRSWSGGLGLWSDYTWRILFIARGQQLNLVLRHLTGQVHDLNSKESYWIFPYFTIRRTFALLEIEDGKGRPVQTVPLNPSRIMFLELHCCLPENRETQFATSSPLCSNPCEICLYGFLNMIPFGAMSLTARRNA